MPKRSATSDSASSSDKKPKLSPKRPPKKWSPEEEAAFKELIHDCCKGQIWTRAKDHPLLKGRGANGVAEHLKAVMGPRPGMRASLRVDEEALMAFRGF